jgi:hypothetical protein
VSRRRAVWLVARRELLERGRSRAFALSLIVSVALILAGILVPTLIGSGPGIQHLGIAGTAPAGFVEGSPPAPAPRTSMSSSNPSPTLRPARRVCGTARWRRS